MRNDVYYRSSTYKFGSGTTTLACALAGIPSVGIEVNDLYAQIAYERIETATGIGVEYIDMLEVV